MIKNQIRTVIFMGDQQGLCEDLYRDKETQRVYIRQECDDSHVRWLTAIRWTGGYEADCHMKSGLVIRVTDKTGNVLFEERVTEQEGSDGTWAAKIGPFSWEATTAVSKEYAEKYGLSTYEEWKAWLMPDAERCGFKGYSENWLFAMSERGPVKEIAKVSFLGVAAVVTAQETRHKICGKSWLCYEVMNASLDTTFSICGYEFQSGS